MEDPTQKKLASLRSVHRQAHISDTGAIFSKMNPLIACDFFGESKFICHKQERKFKGCEEVYRKCWIVSCVQYSDSCV